jgi:VCBS repeat-containing protein
MRKCLTLQLEGMKEPNQRKQRLRDLLALTEKAQEEGFGQVSLTIDTNGNYQYTKNFNKDIQSFL